MSARRSGRARELRQLLIGVALLAAVLEGQQLFGMITSDDRLDPALRDATAPVDVVSSASPFRGALPFLRARSWLTPGPLDFDHTRRISRRERQPPAPPISRRQ